jgi:hypothetical protein
MNITHNDCSRHMTTIHRSKFRDLPAKEKDLQDWVLGSEVRRIFTHPEVFDGAPIFVMKSAGALYFDAKHRPRILLPARFFKTRGGNLLEQVVFHEAAWAYDRAMYDPVYAKNFEKVISKDPLDWYNGLVTLQGCYKALYPEIKRRYARGRCSLCKQPARPCMKRHAKGRSCA